MLIFSSGIFILNNTIHTFVVIFKFFFFFRYLNAIQTICPHILRYLTTAVITNKQRPSVMKELVKVIQQVRILTF